MAQSDEERSERENYVVNQSDGILPMYEAFYIEALTYCAGRAGSAFERFDRALAEGLDQATIVATAHEALSHVAALSRYFWPAKGKPLHLARAKRLREALGIDDSSPLADRGLRNVLEHFDERLDTFLLQDLVGYMFPGPLVGKATLNEDALGNIFRLVDPVSQVFVLLGERYEFGPMRVAVENILEKLARTTGGRLPSNARSG
jgi:hypothetical protein